MPKYQLAALATTTLNTVPSTQSTLKIEDIFNNIETTNKISYDKFVSDLDSFLVDSFNNDISSPSSKMYLLFAALEANKNTDKEIAHPIIDKFRELESKAFEIDPTSSFMNYVFEKLRDELGKITSPTLTTNEAELMVQSFVNNEMSSQTFLDNFGQWKGREAFKSIIRTEITPFIQKYNITDNTIIENIIKKIGSEYENVIKKVVDTKCFSNAGEPYLKLNSIIIETKEVVRKSLNSNDILNIIAPALRSNFINEFRTLVNNKNNIDSNFGPKNKDYLLYYLINNYDEFLQTGQEPSKYLFKTLFGEDESNWSQTVKDFYKKWFDRSIKEDPQIEFIFNNFSLENSSLSIIFDINIKIDTWQSSLSDKVEKILIPLGDPKNKWPGNLIKDFVYYLKNKPSWSKLQQTLKELGKNGYLLTNSLLNSTTMWNVIKEQTGFDMVKEISDYRKNNPEFTNSIFTIDDFSIDITKDLETWIFNIFIDKKINVDQSDPVAMQHSVYKEDDFVQVKMETVFSDIRKNQMENLSPDLRQTKEYGGIYKEELTQYISDLTSDSGLIPLNSLKSSGWLRNIFLKQYSSQTIEDFYNYLLSIELNGKKYSEDNSGPNRLGNIGFKYIADPVNNEIGYFTLVIENNFGSNKDLNLKLKEENVKLLKYQTPLERFKDLLKNAKLNKLINNGPNLFNTPFSEIQNAIDGLITPSNEANSSRHTKTYLDTFANIYGLDIQNLGNAWNSKNDLEISADQSIIWAKFRLNNGEVIKKAVSGNLLSLKEKEEFKRKIDEAMESIKSQIMAISNPNLKNKMLEDFKSLENDVNQKLQKVINQEQAEQIEKLISSFVMNLSHNFGNHLSDNLIKEAKNKFPNGIPKKIRKIIEDYPDEIEKIFEGQSPEEIIDSIIKNKNILSQLEKSDPNQLFNISKSISLGEKYALLAFGGTLGIGGLSTSGTALATTIKNKKLVKQSKTKIKRRKALLITNILISLMAIGGSIAIFIFIFFTKGGL